MSYDYARFRGYCDEHRDDAMMMDAEATESRITASEAKRWADKVYGHGSVSLVRREGSLLHRVGFIDLEGFAIYPGEGKTWDEAVTRAGGDPEEIESLRRQGQG